MAYSSLDMVENLNPKSIKGHSLTIIFTSPVHVEIGYEIGKFPESDNPDSIFENSFINMLPRAIKKYSKFKDIKPIVNSDTKQFYSLEKIDNINYAFLNINDSINRKINSDYVIFFHRSSMLAFLDDYKSIKSNNPEDGPDTTFENITLLFHTAVTIWDVKHKFLIAKCTINSNELIEIIPCDLKEFDEFVNEVIEELFDDTPFEE